MKRSGVLSLKKRENVKYKVGKANSRENNAISNNIAKAPCNSSHYIAEIAVKESKT